MLWPAVLPPFQVVYQVFLLANFCCYFFCLLFKRCLFNVIILFIHIFLFVITSSINVVYSCLYYINMLHSVFILIPRNRSEKGIVLINYLISKEPVFVTVRFLL